jgi:AcrR family transcriptional regulator
MLDSGYASVSYRALAAKAGVTPSLVQYYFPTLDDMFVAAIRRRRDKNLQRLADRLRTHADEPLHVIWE